MITFSTYKRTIASRLRHKKSGGSQFDFVGKESCSIEEYVAMTHNKPTVYTTACIWYGEDHYDMLYSTVEFEKLKEALRAKFKNIEPEAVE
jgi:hypothetical protein